jgi:ArsR family transcriptional regulator, arsenate/arsenite/antimonite-responsive transcriptional repressor
MELSELFKTLGDETRLRIFNLLLDGELCVCDIESALRVSQVNASRHLAKMKSSGLLQSRKNAQWVYYSMNKDFAAKHEALIESLKDEMKKVQYFREDMKSLKEFLKTKKSEKC